MDGRINVSTANIYADATYRSEVVSQGLLGESLHIVETKDDFAFVTLSDTYQGWISRHQWVPARKSTGRTLRVRSHFMSIYGQDSIRSEQVRDAVLGSILCINEEKEGWFLVELPDGQKGWCETKHFTAFNIKSRREICDFAHEFLGYPYFWGGRSPKGFDCSGFTQTVFGLSGVALPRDSWQQHRDGRFLSDNHSQAQPGDLYFFSEQGNKITHVGMALGNDHIIHARGRVRINSLKSGADDFDPQLLDTFVDVRGYLE